MTRTGRARATVALVALAASCVTGQYGRVTVDQAITADQVAALQVGSDTLATCLERLGAPHRVLETPAAADGAPGMVLLWAWQHERGWGIVVSTSYDDAPLRLQFDRTRDNLPACALWFGADLRLERADLGTVASLLPGRVRPSLVDGD
ncbi:MAG: hypothetical protein WAT39_23055 [Planctomycetota bacterium]